LLKFPEKGGKNAGREKCGTNRWRRKKKARRDTLAIGAFAKFRRNMRDLGKSTFKKEGREEISRNGDLPWSTSVERGAGKEKVC